MAYVIASLLTLSVKTTYPNLRNVHMSITRRYTLTISCPDRTGIIAAVSGFIARHGGFIVEASYHTEQEAQRFFMRQEIRADSLPFDLIEFHAQFSSVANDFAMDWSISDSAQKKRLAILVSKQDHCLNDLVNAK
jgi:formyltetrahydrofolate deformylase